MAAPATVIATSFPASAADIDTSPLTLKLATPGISGSGRHAFSRRRLRDFRQPGQFIQHRPAVTTQWMALESHPPQLAKTAARIPSRWSVVAPSAWQMNRLDRSIPRHLQGARHIVRNGVDQSCFHPGSQQNAREALGLKSDHPIGLVVANLGLESPSKDFQTFFGALMRLSQQPAQFPIDIVVVGHGQTSQTFGAITVHYRPHTGSPGRLACYYQAADFLINPTYEETFSNVTAEAMCCGTPVLASKVAALPELVSDLRTGLLVAPADVEALTAALGLLSRNRNLRRTLSTAAAAYAEREFSLGKMTDGYLEVFDQVIEEIPSVSGGRQSLQLHLKRVLATLRTRP